MDKMILIRIISPSSDTLELDVGATLIKLRFYALLVVQACLNSLRTYQITVRCAAVFSSMEISR